MHHGGYFPWWVMEKLLEFSLFLKISLQLLFRSYFIFWDHNFNFDQKAFSTESSSCLFIFVHKLQESPLTISRDSYSLISFNANSCLREWSLTLRTSSLPWNSSCIVFQACFELVAPIILGKIVSSTACWRANKVLESFCLFFFNTFFWASGGVL